MPDHKSPLVIMIAWSNPQDDCTQHLKCIRERSTWCSLSWRLELHNCQGGPMQVMYHCTQKPSDVKRMRGLRFLLARECWGHKDITLEWQHARPSHTYDSVCNSICSDNWCWWVENIFREVYDCCKPGPVFLENIPCGTESTTEDGKHLNGEPRFGRCNPPTVPIWYAIIKSSINT